MLLTYQDNIEMDDIKSLDEVQIVGIDGSTGESGFLKFIEAKGSKIAVFTTKLASLSENKAQISFLDILDAISIETDNLENFQYIVVSTKNGTSIVKYDGSTFTIENQLVAGDFQIDKLIQFKSLILGIDYSKNFIFYWSISNIGDGQLIEWSSLETNSQFNDLKTCGSLCAIGQVSSDGISAFYQSANCLCIGQLDATDACAEAELSTQFLCNGRGEVSAYVLSATEGDGHIPCFSVSQIGDGQTKNIQIVKFDDVFYMYALNDAGNPYLYQLTERYGSNQADDTILTGFSSTLIGNIDNIHMTDIQRFFDSSTQLDGVLFSGEDGISTHFYGYSKLEKICSESISDLAIFKSYNDEDGYEYSLMYPIGHDVVVSSLTMGGDNQILTAFTDDDDLVDKVCVGEFCFFTHNVQNHAILHYEDEEGNQQHQILEMDDSAPAQIKDLITFRSSWTSDIEGTAYDILVAAVGKTLHATWFNGKTKTLIPLRQSTTLKFSLAEEIINLDFQKSNVENQFKVVAATAKSFRLFDMILNPREDSCQITIENPKNFSLDDPNINIEKALINNNQTVVYMTDDGCVYEKPIYENNDFGAKTLIASDAQTIVKSTRINKDDEDYRPDVWCQQTNNVMFSCTTRTPMEAPNEKINSVAQTSIYGIFIGSNDGIYKTEKSLNLSNIELNKQIIGGAKTISFANGIVFVAGDVGLSCFQYSYPRSSSELSALNNDIEFQGLFANAIGLDDIRLVAWTGNKIYSKIYSLNSIDEDSFGELNIDKVYPNVVVDTMINPIDQLKIDVNEEKLNIFMMHFGVENTDDRYVFTNDSNELYWDLDQISLYSYGSDAQTKMHKIIQNDESGDRFDYLSLDKKRVIRYPEGTLIKEFDESIDDAIKSNRIWYVKKSNQWTYDEKQLPEFDGKTIDVFGILELNGMTYLGSDYGILSATHYKSTIVNENSRYPLTKNVDFEGSFESFNVGKTNSFVLVTRESSNLVHAYSFLEKSSTLEEIKFLAPTSVQNPGVQAEIENIWMVNGRYSDGAFCYPKVVEPVEDYMNWLNRIDEGVLYPFTNVNEGHINSISHHQDKFYVLKAEEIIEFTNYGDEIVFKAIDGSHNTQNAYSHITPIDNKRALVVGRGGICIYSSKSCSSLKTAYASSLGKYCLDGNFTYAHNDGSDILTSLSYKIWKPLLSLPTMVVPNDIVCINKKTYLFSANDGLYGTKYHYTLVNDVKPIERETVLEIYNDLISSRLSTELDVELENHISTHHASNSFITSLNRDYATTQLDDIVSSWQKIKVSSDNAMNLGIKNDIITEIYFGEQNDGDIVVQISNYLDDKDSNIMEEVSGVTYITKRWMSGITEIYINVPTTRTYYLNNLYGASNCNLAPELEISRKNLDSFGVEKMTQNGILSTHYTTLNIGITSAEYSIKQLLDVQINGMSLPLKIYQDQSQYGGSGLAGKLYSSFIEPSIVKKYNITTTDEEGNFQFEFACFGTDAQAIHLMFYDESSRSNSATVKIIFDPNGGEGTMAAQKFIIIQDENGNPVLEQKKLNWMVIVPTNGQ